jgi:hypothetical protein
MAEESAISFMTTLVLFLVLWNSKLPSINLSVAFAVVSGLLGRLVQSSFHLMKTENCQNM